MNIISLREQCKNLCQTKYENIIKTKDVIIKNPSKLHPYWQLARVIKLISDDDKNVLSVIVKKK